MRNKLFLRSSEAFQTSWQRTQTSLPQSRSSSRCFALPGQTFCLLGMDLHLLVLNIEPEMVVYAHVLVGHPDQGKQGDHVPPPVGAKQFVSRKHQEGCSDVVAETVFASE